MRTVQEFMTPDPVSIDEGQPITEAAQLMREHDVGILPVTRAGELIGVITDRDIVMRAVAEGTTDEPIATILKEGVFTVSPDDDERAAVTAMSKHDVRRLPVSSGGQLVGMVSVGDLATRADTQLAGTVMKNTGPLDRPVERSADDDQRQLELAALEAPGQEARP